MTRRPFALLPPGGVGIPALDSLVRRPAPDAAPVADLGENLADRIRAELAANPLDLPSASPVVARLLKLTRRPDVSAVEVAETLAGDPAIAAHLVRCANSAAFCGREEIVGVQQAVARLGFRMVEGLVFFLAHRPLFRFDDPVDGAWFEAVWKHSLASATACRAIAKHRCELDEDEAFLAGLVHDLGRIAILRSLGRLRARGAIDPLLPREVLAPVLEDLDPEIGAELLRRWRFPARIVGAVRGYRAAPAEPSWELLTGAVGLAHLVAISSGFGAGAFLPLTAALESTRGALALGIDAGEVRSITAEAEADLAALLDLFR